MFNRMLCYLMNTFCTMMYKREYGSFANIRDASEVQRQLLLSLLHSNRNTLYGERYAFDKIKSIKEYQCSVPITTYEDYSWYIEEIKAGRKNILTEDEVMMLELSSGSTSASKYIPYTKTLKLQFQKGLKPWVYNLFSSYEGIKHGQAYWSITPAVHQKQYTEGGLPIGFEEDSEYFGWMEKYLFRYLFAVPSEISKVRDMENFKYLTALFLLNARKLTFISVWNPTYLMLIIQAIEQYGDRLVDNLRKGVVTPPNVMEEDVRKLFKLSRNEKRALEIEENLKEKRLDMLWPNLKLISCWTDGNSEAYAHLLRELFPKVEMQGKGLIATEAFVSFPLKGESGARLSLHSHFFEFISMSDEKIYLAHELRVGETYCLVVTTGGGLYRYNLQDLVLVTGFSGAFPRVRFIGKKDKVSDIFGEKLNEYHVKKTIEALFQQYGIKPEFYMLAPSGDRYVLFIDRIGAADALAQKLDQGLRENFHYDYCRRLGQLQEAQIFLTEEKPYESFVEECAKRGQRLGDIKPAVLDLRQGWENVFKGRTIV
ncbi:MAG: hypothetical protein K0R80_306 [Clostridia bacterium]|nr:hypothetical protein [Clostridia bacterium]